MVKDAQSEVKLSESEIILKTAIKTFVAILVIFPLLFILWTLVFPFSACDFYDEIGNVSRAYDSAKIAVKTSSGTSRTNAKIRAVNYVISLYGADSSYAESLIADTNDFLLDNDCGLRATKIDEFNIETAPKMFHPAIYGYLDYIRSQNVKAKAKNGDNLIWVGQELKALDDALLNLDVSVTQQLVAILSVNTDLVDDHKAVSYANEYLNFIVNKANAYYAPAEEVSLQMLYEAYAYGKLKTIMLDKGIAVQSDFAENIQFGGQTYSFDNYYDALVEKY